MVFMVRLLSEEARSIPTGLERAKNSHIYISIIADKMMDNNRFGFIPPKATATPAGQFGFPQIFHFSPCIPRFGCGIISASRNAEVG
jgi:hypothetical protein